jgi:hypothetical protein
VAAVPELRYLRKHCFEIVPRLPDKEVAQRERLVLQAPNEEVVKSWARELDEHQKRVFEVLHRQKKQLLSQSSRDPSQRSPVKK